MTSSQRLIRYIKPYWPTLLMSVISASIYGIVSAFPTYIIKHTVDDIFVNRYSSLIIPFIALFFFFFILKGIFMYVTSYYMHWVGNKVISDIRRDLFSSIIHFPVKFFKDNQTGKLLSYFLNDVQMIQNATSISVKNGVRSFFEALFLITFAFIQNQQLTLLLLLVVPPMVFIIKRLGASIKRRSGAIQDEVGMMSSNLQEVFIGVRDVKACGNEEIEVKRFDKQLARCFDSIMKKVHTESLLPALIEPISMIGGCIAFYVATQQVLSGAITAGQLASFIAAVLLSYQPLKRIVSVYGDLKYGLSASERIFAVMDTRYPAFDRGSVVWGGFNHDIQIKNLSFSYDDGSKVFKNFSVILKKGQAIGVVGQSGSGKSTLCDLLLGFIQPTSGLIMLDGIDMQSIALSELRKHIGYVGQQPFLFNDTVFKNVAYATPGASFQEVVDACKAAHAHEFIQNLSHGYDTFVGENGGLLSGGQKQRLTIARALLKDPEIFIFDEATSALDHDSEKMIQQALNQLKGKKTLIVISHRPALLQSVDTIIQLNNSYAEEYSENSYKPGTFI